MKNTHFTVYCDSDGVIADFPKKILEITGKDIKDLNKKTLWESVSNYNKNVCPFYESLDMMEDADELLSFLEANFEHVKILTAAGYTPSNAREQKLEWFKKHYPNLDVIVVDKGVQKAQYAHSSAILIDDTAKCIDPFREAGGIGILHSDAKSTIEQLNTILNEKTL